MTFLTHLQDSTLQRLIGGELVDAEASAARAHLDECGPCRSRASEVSAIFTLLAQPAVRPQPPIDFLAAVMAKIEREAPARVAMPVFSLRTTMGAVAAGVATLAGGIGLLVAGGAGGHVSGIAVQYATALTGVATHAGLALTVVKAGAPVLAAAAIASLAILTPIFLKTLQTIQPNAIRARARS
jgi:predicted anti-sigma-YlaC factor YlaD